jgi:hypothetical protein
LGCAVAVTQAAAAPRGASAMAVTRTVRAQMKLMNTPFD